MIFIKKAMIDVIATINKLTNYSWKSLPSGNKTKCAILKYCFPNGIPMMVTQKITPTRSKTKALIQPPKIA